MSDHTAVIVEPAGQHRYSVIWLHGLGADGNDFLPVVDELALPASLGIRWVFPHAPVMPVTINGGYRMRAWYDITVPDLTTEVDAAGIRRSRDLLLQRMAHEQGRGIAPERIILAGFSQGGVIALAATLAAEHKPGAVLALSTYLPLRDAPQPGTVPVFMGHGELDDIVPPAAAADARDYLAGQGFAVDWHAYPMAHSVCADEIADIRSWLLARLAAAPGI